MNDLNLVQCEDTDDELLSEFRSIASRLAERLHLYRIDIDRVMTERDGHKQDAAMLAERIVNAARITRTRETIDGVECERISGLDVIVPVGLIPDGEDIADVRSARIPLPGRYIGVDGRVYQPSKISLPDDSCELLLMLADNPATAPVPTWTPPVSLPDGEYVALPDGGTCNTSALSWQESTARIVWRDYTKPTNGRWQVKSGRATYLGPNQESPQ